MDTTHIMDESRRFDGFGGVWDQQRLASVARKRGASFSASSSSGSGAGLVAANGDNHPNATTSNASKTGIKVGSGVLMQQLFSAHRRGPPVPDATRKLTENSTDPRLQRTRALAARPGSPRSLFGHRSALKLAGGGGHAQTTFRTAAGALLLNKGAGTASSGTGGNAVGCGPLPVPPAGGTNAMSAANLSTTEGNVRGLATGNGPEQAESTPDPSVACLPGDLHPPVLISAGAPPAPPGGGAPVATTTTIVSTAVERMFFSKTPERGRDPHCENKLFLPVQLQQLQHQEEQPSSVTFFGATAAPGNTGSRAQQTAPLRENVRDDTQPTHAMVFKNRTRPFGRSRMHFVDRPQAQRTTINLAAEIPPHTAATVPTSCASEDIGLRPLGGSSTNYGWSSEMSSVPSSKSSSKQCSARPSSEEAGAVRIGVLGSTSVEPEERNLVDFCTPAQVHVEKVGNRREDRHPVPELAEDAAALDLSRGLLLPSENYAAATSFAATGQDSAATERGGSCAATERGGSSPPSRSGTTTSATKVVVDENNGVVPLFNHEMDAASTTGVVAMNESSIGPRQRKRLAPCNWALDSDVLEHEQEGDRPYFRRPSSDVSAMQVRITASNPRTTGVPQEFSSAKKKKKGKKPRNYKHGTVVVPMLTSTAAATSQAPGASDAATGGGGPAGCSFLPSRAAASGGPLNSCTTSRAVSAAGGGPPASANTTQAALALQRRMEEARELIQKSRDPRVWYGQFRKFPAPQFHRAEPSHTSSQRVVVNTSAGPQQSSSFTSRAPLTTCAAATQCGNPVAGTPTPSIGTAAGDHQTRAGTTVGAGTGTASTNTLASLLSSVPESAAPVQAAASAGPLVCAPVAGGSSSQQSTALSQQSAPAAGSNSVTTIGMIHCNYTSTAGAAQTVPAPLFVMEQLKSQFALPRLEKAWADRAAHVEHCKPSSFNDESHHLGWLQLARADEWAAAMRQEQDLFYLGSSPNPFYSSFHDPPSSSVGGRHLSIASMAHSPYFL
ncbi:unnamed protein product [Amoebophrya sp. A120]|nr:unnamed protein product [Amoebophrya sp. A120]|eukprot:GSA120T00023044001.1